MRTVKTKGDLDLIDIASHYDDITQNGKEWYMVCPLPEHHDTNPSCAFNPEKQMWYCHGCGEGGDVFDLLMKVHGTDFRGAIEALRDHHQIDYRPAGGSKGTGEKEQLRKVVQWACDAYHAHLKSRGQLYDRDSGSFETARNYLNNRNFDLGDVNRWGLGWSGNYPTALAELARKQEVDRDLLVKAGLLHKRSDQEGKYRDVFVGRIMIPVRDAAGRPVGFAGRKISSGSRQKYINTGDTPIFKKADILMNWDQAAKWARKRNRIVVVEGPLDLLRTVKIGIDETVCTMGTAMSDAHVEMLSGLGVTRVILFGDGDEAGVKASIKRGEKLLLENQPAYVVETPEGEDPDSFGDKKPTSTSRAIRIAPTYLRFLYNQEPKRDALSKAELADSFRVLLSKINDETRRALLANEVQEILGVEFKAPAHLAALRPEKPAPKKEGTVPQIELDMIWAVLFHWDEPAVFELTAHVLPTLPKGLLSDLGKQTLSFIMSQLEQWDGDHEKLITNSSYVGVEPEVSQLLSVIRSMNRDANPDWTKFLREVTQWATIESAKHELEQLRQRLTGSEDGGVSILEQYVKTSRRRLNVD